MAVESWTERVTESALRLRRPACRFAGDVRSAVCIGAIIVGAFSLLIGSIYSWRPWNYFNMATLVMTSCAFAYASAVMDLVLIFGVLVKEDKILKYTLCLAMAVYLVCVPQSLCTFLGSAACGYLFICSWEMFRIALYLVHLGVMYCLLAELRGDPLPPLSPPAPPPEGWLKNNLASSAQDALLKVHVADNDNSSNNYNNRPAVIAPRA